MFRIKNRIKSISIPTNIFVLAVFLPVLLGSCSQEVASVSQRIATANTRYASQNGVVEMPQLVDLEIEDRLVSGSYSASNISVDEAKSLAVANAIKMANADVLIEPSYDITVTNNNVSASVKGHPAHYKNFRKPPVVLETSAGKAVHTQTGQVQSTKVEEETVKSAWENRQEAKAETAPEPEVKKAPEPVVKEEEIVEPPAKEEAKAAEPEETESGKLRTPCFIIGCSALKSEPEAETMATKLQQKGLKANYLWIPDYDPAGKQLYRVYVGPYDTRSEADAALPRVKAVVAGAYVQTLK